MRKLTDSHPDFNLIRKAVILAWSRLGLPHLFFKTRVVWNNLAAKEREAEADFYGNKYMIIVLDPNVWKNSTIEQKRATVVHEVCHLALIAMQGKRATRRPHSRAFFKLMRKTGFFNVERRSYYTGRYHALMKASVAR